MPSPPIHMDVPFSQRCISQRNTHNSNNVLLMGEEFFLGDVCTVAGIEWWGICPSPLCHSRPSPLPLMSFSPLSLDVAFEFLTKQCFRRRRIALKFNSPPLLKFLYPQAVTIHDQKTSNTVESLLTDTPRKGHCIKYLSTMDKTKFPNVIPPINIMRLESHKEDNLYRGQTT